MTAVAFCIRDLKPSHVPDTIRERWADLYGSPPHACVDVRRRTADDNGLQSGIRRDHDHRFYFENRDAAERWARQTFRNVKELKPEEMDDAS